jgi:hypothetical protein
VSSHVRLDLPQQGHYCFPGPAGVGAISDGIVPQTGVQRTGRSSDAGSRCGICATSVNFCRGLNDRHAVFHMWIDEMDYPPWPVS